MLSIRKKIKPETSTPLLNKLKLANEMAGQVVQSNSNRSAIDEVCTMTAVRVKIITYLFEVSDSLTIRNRYRLL